MKNTLLVIGLILVLALIGAYLFRDPLQYWVAQQVLTPAEDFNPGAAPSTPDYIDEATWSALPSTTDGADITPNGLSDVQATAPADVFFIHPTTYFSADAWNAPLDDAAANKLIEESVNVAQASSFNGCCAIYAPRYRQATMASFFPGATQGGDSSNGARAMELAYSDVRRAFSRFLNHDNQNRPFILAGHSQGSMHIKRLLREEILGKNIQSKLVAVYAVGATYTAQEMAQDFAALPTCSTPRQTGCLISWNTVGPNITQFRDASDDVCVNPLTWTDANANHAANPGAFVTATQTLLPGEADASCVNGQVLVTELKSETFQNLPMNMGIDNYHILDYSLFYASIRDNAAQRVASFLEK